MDTQATTSSAKEQRTIQWAYEWFLELPVPIVLAVLWLMGAALVGLGMVAIYSVGSVLLDAASGT